MFLNQNSRDFIKLFGSEICFYRFGNDSKKPTALILHGVRADTDRILPLVELLRTRYNVITLDLPGYGFSRNYPIPKGENYINFCVKVLKEFFLLLNLKPQSLTLVGSSLGANIIINLLIDSQELNFRKVGLIGPFYSESAMSISKFKRNFTLWYLREFARDRIPTKVFQFIVNNTVVFRFLLKLFDSECRKNLEILRYEIKEWRLMTIQHLAKSNLDILETDYSKVGFVLQKENLVFTYPEFDQYIDVGKSAKGFQKIFARAHFVTYRSREHMPRGNFIDDKTLMNEFEKIILSLELI